MRFEIYNWDRGYMTLDAWIHAWMINHDYHDWPQVGVLEEHGDVFVWHWDDMTDQGEWVMEDLEKEYARDGVYVERVR
jgi:hypothetical protein|tara:strand:+ start:403 stop:636 length:234 start_codon:yes stop_codon:yes gene_type:complete